MFGLATVTFLILFGYQEALNEANGSHIKAYETSQANYSRLND